MPRTRRRSGRRALLVVVAVLGLSLVAVPSALSGSWNPWADPGGDSGLGTAPVTAVPGDEPARGLVYKGLRPARKGSTCVGGYETADAGTCSHGPDAAPPGLDVKKDVAPVAAPGRAPAPPARETAPADDARIVAEEGGVPAGGALALVPDAAPAAQVAVGPHGVVCDGDGRSGKRVQVLYVFGTGTASRYDQYLPSFRTWAAGVDTIYNASAQETGGVRHVRYVTTADCQVAVDEVEVPAAAMADFSATINALRSLGYNRTDRKYMIFGESRVYCGIGTFAGDERAGSANRSNSGPSYGRTDAGCWGAGTAAHELGHNLGAVNNGAPNSSKAGHCVDEYDVMCYKDTATTQLRTVCADRAQDQRLDCGHDDYYHTDPSPGSYLATRWNVADNEFLIRGDGGGPAPTPTPTAAPTTVPPTTGPPAPPTPTRTPTRGPTPPPTTGTPAPPTPTATATPVPPGLRPLSVADVTATSVRLSWPAAAAGTRYGVVLDGRVIGTTRATAVRIVGMRPATTYRAAIVVRSAPYTATVPVTTAAAAAPAAGASFRLTNALTGGVAELAGSRTADRTPLVSRAPTGAANQAWELVAAGDAYRLRSKATGRCVAALGGVRAGAPLVQGGCGAGAVAWTLTRTADGFALTTGDLAVGLGRSRFGDGRLLVLQRTGAGRHQSWTAVPV